MSNFTDSIRTHNDIVGNDANASRIPGADQATTGHQYEAVFPKDTNGRTIRQGTEQRPQEFLPRPTGRDAPPRHDVRGADFTRGVGMNDDVTPSTAIQSPSYNAASGPGGYDSPPSDIRELNQPRVGGVVVDSDPWAEKTSASDTLTGATSRDVNDSLGHPGQGQTSAQLHHDGFHAHRKRDDVGLGGYGTGMPDRADEGMDRRGRDGA